MIGPCDGRRLGRNIKEAYVAVLDADSSIDLKTKETVEGAPPPIQVHLALKEAGISHILYTTFSHGTYKGNRYRIIFPVHLKDASQLKAFLVYIVNILQEKVGIPIALTRESFTWGQGWTYPRVRNKDADFLHLIHVGKVPDPADLVQLLPQEAAPRKAPKNERRGPYNPNSPIGMMGDALPIRKQLEERGYDYVSQGLMVNEGGEEVPVLRYRRPGSDSAPGVALFLSKDGWRVYSHHTNDVLNNGHSNDAFDVFRLFSGYHDTAEGMEHAIPLIQEQVRDEMNRDYPSIMEGGTKYRYGNVHVDELGSTGFRFVDETTFLQAMQNKPGVPVFVNDKDGVRKIKMVPRGVYWKSCSDRVLYNDILYAPKSISKPCRLTLEKNGRPYFNMFRDWHLKPIRGAWALIEWHLRYSICGGKEEEYEYLLDWFAHLLQYPNEKPEVALVLQGGRGWGKTLVFSEMAKKLGSHAIIIGNNRLLTGNFNQHMRDKLLMVVEESFWSGNHAHRGVLQHLISDEVTTFEKKGIDAGVGLSYLRVVMISNEEWVVPAAGDERRYFLPTLTSAAAQADREGDGKKGKFFPRLLNELHNGGIEAFAYDMSRRKINTSRVRDVVQTERLVQQKLLSLDWIDRWFLECLENGRISSRHFQSVTWGSRGCFIPSEQVMQSLSEHVTSSMHRSDRGVLMSLGHRHKRIFYGGNEVIKFKRPEGVFYRYPPLENAKLLFEEYTGMRLDWGKTMDDNGPQPYRENYLEQKYQ